MKLQVYDFVLLLITIGATSGSRILLMPYHWISTINELAHIGRELISRGHQVHILLLDKYVFIDEFQKSWPDINLITYAAKYPDYNAEELKDVIQMYDYYVKEKEHLVDLRENNEGLLGHCHNLLEDEAMERKVRELEIDLILMAAFTSTRCYFVFAYRLGLPYINIVTEVDPWQTRNPSLPSFVPIQFQMPVLTPKMTFWERLQNVKNFVCWALYVRQVPMASDELVTKYAPERPAVSMNTLARDSLMWFYDTDLAIDYPRPMMPNEVNVGGLSVEPPKPLSSDLETFAAAAKKGLIVVSFGSVSIVPEHIMLKVIDGLEIVSMDYHIFLRWHLPIEKPDVPANILLLDHLPQNDLLAHPKTCLFVTHCGANGQFEALSHGVPMVNIPGFYDQMYNAKRADYHGFSKTLDILTFTADDLYVAIHEVISNPSYKDKISRASAIFNSQPLRPRDRATFWVEHVLKHGADHLRSTALDMPTYQFLMLDVAGFLLALLFGGILLTCILFKVSQTMIGL